MREKLLILTLFLCANVAAQPMLKTLPQYACVRYEKNVLHLPADSAKMQLFFAKMDTLMLFGKGKINILHVGGSHIQAGVFSHQIRKHLSHCNPENQAACGIIYPYSVAKTNTPINFSAVASGDWQPQQNSKKPYKYNLEMGVLGVAAQTSDSAASVRFSINRHVENGFWQFNRLRILGYASHDSVCPIVCTQNDTLEAVFDSISGSYLACLQQFNDSATVRFRFPTDTVADFTLCGILPENDREGITYFSCGVNGASTAAWLRCSRFEHDLQFIRPDLAILSIGINDASVPFGSFNAENFKENYRKIIAQIRRVSPDCALIFTTNNDSYHRVGRRSYVPNKNGKLVQQAFFDLAKEQNAAVWDLYAIMGEFGSSDAWEISGLMKPDRVHFTRTGYTLLGDMFFNALIDSYLFKMRN